VNNTIPPFNGSELHSGLKSRFLDHYVSWWKKLEGMLLLPLGLDMPFSAPGYGKSIFGENLIQIMQVLTVLLDAKIWI